MDHAPRQASPWPGAVCVKTDTVAADDRPMRIRPLFLVLPALPLMAACGGGGSAPQTLSSIPSATAPAPVLRPDAVVLRTDELGYGQWIVVDSKTGPVSLRESMKGDPASIRPVERRSYRSGYNILYVNAERIGVFSAVFSYTNRRDARAVAAAWAGMAAKHNFTRMTAPAGAPGAGFGWWKTTTREAGETVSLYLAQWVQGSAIGMVMTFGRGVSPHSLMLLARAQNEKMAAATST